MIIKCPKCKTEFEIDDNIISNKRIKFQCAECAFVWSVGNDVVEELPVVKNVASVVEEKVPYNPPLNSQVEMEKKKLLYGLGVEERGMEKKTSSWYEELLEPKNILVFLLGVVLFFVIFFVFSFVYESSSNNANSNSSQSIFEKKEEDIDTSKLYIEISKPLTLTREGVNDYIMIRGFVYNPTNVKMSVPKLIIRLENKDGRILQEQEREIEVKELAPLEKTDFMFKVFKFSNQVQIVKVEFDESGKI